MTDRQRRYNASAKGKRRSRRWERTDYRRGYRAGFRTGLRKGLGLAADSPDLTDALRKAEKI
jgi:hypothetical protein